MTPSDALLARAFASERAIEAGWHRAGALCADAVAIEAAHPDPSHALPRIVRLLGERGLLDLFDAEGGISWGAICLARERLGYASPLVELAFAMQGLGSYPITVAGTVDQKARFLPAVLAGESVAAFALTEPEAGSDLAGIATTARRDGDSYVLTGEKVFISNAAIAGTITLFAATAPPNEKRRLSAFVLRGDAAGLTARPTRVLGGHPIGELTLDGVRVPLEDRLGEEGNGMRIALGTLHRFRATVGAAAVGFGQRALDEAVQHVLGRRQFGRALAEQQAVQMAIADMACDMEAARLLVYRAAALADAGGNRGDEAKAASMAKLFATEAAFRTIDRAVQLHGARGVAVGHPVARLYEDVRALRIYEGASDVQRLLIARELLGTSE
jgi:acyl-CoA dehydrogenase